MWLRAVGVVKGCSPLWLMSCLRRSSVNLGKSLETQREDIILFDCIFFDRDL